MTAHRVPIGTVMVSSEEWEALNKVAISAKQGLALTEGKALLDPQTYVKALELALREVKIAVKALDESYQTVVAKEVEGLSKNLRGHSDWDGDCG